MPSIRYPKNWHSNGYGWHNAAALSYGGQKPPPSETSSGVSSLYPEGSPCAAGGPNLGFQLAYGFAPGVLPCQVPNPAPDATSGHAHPNIGWALTSDTTSFDGVEDTKAVAHEEVPCQAIRVPEDEMPIYGHVSTLFFNLISG